MRIYENNIVGAKLHLNDPDECWDFSNFSDPLENELLHFINCIDTRETPDSDLKYARMIADYIDIAHFLLDIVM